VANDNSSKTRREVQPERDVGGTSADIHAERHAECLGKIDEKSCYGRPKLLNLEVATPRARRLLLEAM
jgi:hypothetical protein